MNVAPEPVDLPVKMPLPQITMTPTILGPFEVVLRWSGLDLSRAFIMRSGWAKTICMIAVCFLICLAMFFRSLILMMDSTKPMTIEWAISCVWGFMSIHGFVSGLCVASWTKSRFLLEFQDTLARVQKHRGPIYGKINLLSIYRKIIIGTVIFVATWAMSSMKGILYEGSPANSSAPFSIGYPVTLNTMYGLDPFVYLLIAFSSSLALIMQVLVYAHVNREWASFNEDLSNTARLQQLAAPGILNNFSTRQVELLRMVKFVSRKTELFTSLSTAFAALTSASALYLVAGFGSEMSVFMNVLSILWMHCSMAVILVAHKQPAQTQMEINNTAQLLLAEDICHISKDDQIWRTCRSMVDRAFHSSTKMYFLQAYAMDQHFAHKILFMAPNIGTLMVLIKKAGLV